MTPQEVKTLALTRALKPCRFGCAVHGCAGRRNAHQYQAAPGVELGAVQLKGAHCRLQSWRHFAH